MHLVAKRLKGPLVSKHKRGENNRKQHVRYVSAGSLFNSHSEKIAPLHNLINLFYRKKIHTDKPLTKLTVSRLDTVISYIDIRGNFFVTAINTSALSKAVNCYPQSSVITACPTQSGRSEGSARSGRKLGLRVSSRACVIRKQSLRAYSVVQLAYLGHDSTRESP